MLTVKGLNKSVKNFALNDITFTIKTGDYMLISGASGSGKTMLLEVLAGIEKQDSGIIILDGKEITNLPIQKRPLGLVYQNQALFPHMTVRQNIEYGLKNLPLTKKERLIQIEKYSQKTNITHLLNRYPKKLSGGEAQRVALVRTLIRKPRCIFLDEPLSSLDQESRNGLIQFLKELHVRGHTFIHITHFPDELDGITNSRAIMKDGQLTLTDK